MNVRTTKDGVVIKPNKREMKVLEEAARIANFVHRVAEKNSALSESGFDADVHIRAILLAIGPAPDPDSDEGKLAAALSGDTEESREELEVATERVMTPAEWAAANP